MLFSFCHTVLYKCQGPVLILSTIINTGCTMDYLLSSCNSAEVAGITPEVNLIHHFVHAHIYFVGSVYI